MKKLFLIILLSIILFGCEKDELICTDHLFHLSFIMDGVYKIYCDQDEEKEPSFTVSNGAGNAIVSDSMQIRFGSIWQFERQFDKYKYNSWPNFVVEHILIVDTHLLDENFSYHEYENFRDVFSPSFKNFTTDPCVFAGIEIGFMDADMDFYSTSHNLCWRPKPIKPDHSKFMYEIISSETFNHELFGKGERVKAIFHCTLYNFSGDSIVIEDGIIESFYRDYP